MFDAKMNVPEAPLHRAEFEHDNCGIGAVVNIKGTKSRETVENARLVTVLVFWYRSATNSFPG